MPFFLQIIDEISMINKSMWNKLQILKKSIPQLIFILVGDYRQCKPIEDDNTKPMKYFDHPVVKYLTNNNRVVLEKIHSLCWPSLEEGCPYNVYQT